MLRLKSQKKNLNKWKSIWKEIVLNLRAVGLFAEHFHCDMEITFLAVCVAPVSVTVIRRSRSTKWRPSHYSTDSFFFFWLYC